MPIYLWILCAVAWWVVGMAIIIVTFLWLSDEIILGELPVIIFCGLLGPITIVAIGMGFVVVACDPFIYRIKQHPWYNIVLWPPSKWKRKE